MKNYVRLSQFSLRYDEYMFIDVPEHFADQLLIGRRITACFGREYQSPDEPYVAVFCRVRRRDREGFKAAMAELADKMILCGYPGYDAFCRAFMNKLESGYT